MKIILVDRHAQAFRWVNTIKPKTFNRAAMQGVLDDGHDTKFMIIHKVNDWWDNLRGMEIVSYENIGHNELTPIQETYMQSLVREIS